MAASTALQAVGELGAAGNPVGGVVVAQLALGPHDALGHRRLGHEEGPGDLGGVEAAEQAQREGDLGVGRQRRVAAEEHQPQLVVGDDVDEQVEVGELGVGVGFHVVGVQSVSSEVAVVAGGLPAQAVDGPVAGGGRDPAAGVRRHALGRPPLGGDGERLRDRVLGEVDVAEDTDQGGGAATGFAPEDVLERISHPPAWGGAPPGPRRRRRTCRPSRGRRRGRGPR